MLWVMGVWGEDLTCPAVMGGGGGLFLAPAWPSPLPAGSTLPAAPHHASLPSAAGGS